jgi:hypothetical protein
LKFLFCVRDWFRSGQNRVLAEYITRLKTQGHRVNWWSPRCRFFPDWIHLPRTGFDFDAAKLETWDVVVLCHPDVVHAGLEFPARQRVYFLQHSEPGNLDAHYEAIAAGCKVLVTARHLVDSMERLGANDVRRTRNGASKGDFYPIEDIGPYHGTYILVMPSTYDGDRLAERAAVRLARAHHLTTVGVGIGGELDQYIHYPSLPDLRRLYSGAVFTLKAATVSSCSLTPFESVACHTPVLLGVETGDGWWIDGKNCARTGYNYDDIVCAGEQWLTDAFLFNRARVAARKFSVHVGWSAALEWFCQWLD